MAQDVKTGHNEQIVTNEHDDKTKDPKSRKYDIYINSFNLKKLILQKNELYKEYKPTINKKTLGLKARIIKKDIDKELSKNFPKKCSMLG